MENEEHYEGLDKNHGLVFTDGIKGDLLETVKWSKFIANVFYTLTALYFVGFFLTLMMYGVSFLTGSTYILVFITIAIGLISIIPIYYLHKFSENLEIALSTADENKMVNGFSNLKSHYRFQFIFLLVLIINYVSGILYTLFFGALAPVIR